MVREAKRYLGLELSGAKNQKTALAALEFYPKEKKVFLLDTYDRVPSGDEALLELIGEVGSGCAKMGVNVPLELPPCLTCKRGCAGPTGCADPSVKWMRDLTRRATRRSSKLKVRDFTPYTQRPIELWVRYQVMSKLPESSWFEIDEALGGSKAPLTARMHFLKRHLKDMPLVEVWPKLSVAVIAKDLGLHRRTISTYRQLEQGSHARGEILEAIIEQHGIFIYERDLRKLSHTLASFDAFICAYTALLSDLDQCTRIPKGFPASSGWVQYPELDARLGQKV